MNLKNYHDNILNRGMIIKKWQPVIDKFLLHKGLDEISSDKLLETISFYSEKHQYYDSLENSEKNILPLAIKIISKLNPNKIEFDEFDQYKMKSQPISYARPINRELFDLNPNYGIVMAQEMENELVNKIVDFIEEKLKNGDRFIFQTPLIQNLQLSNIEGNLTISTILNYK